MNRLVTIKFSHYNEQARWALDFAGEPYAERGYMPLFHMAGVAVTAGLGGRKDGVSSKFSTPVLVRPGVPSMHDSREIMQFAHQQLKGRGQSLGLGLENPEVLRWVEHFHDELGPHTRRAGYGFGLESAAILRRLAWKNVGKVQAFLFAMASPFIRVGIVRSLGATPARAVRSADKVRAVFVAVGDRLGSQPFLAGSEFSAADLSFAALAAPSLLVQPHEGYGAVFPTVEEAPTLARELALELRASVAGKHAMRMFREFRKPAGEQPAAKTPL